RFLQELLAEYLTYKKETRIQSTEDLVLSLQDQLTRRDKELQAAQEGLIEFQKTNNLAVLEEETKSAGLYLSDLNQQLAKLRMQRQLLRQVSTRFSRSGGSNGVMGYVSPVAETNAAPTGTNGTPAFFAGGTNTNTLFGATYEIAGTNTSQMSS